VFVDHDVAFVLIGGAAIQSHALRFDTQDIDLRTSISPPTPTQATSPASRRHSTASSAAS
jgi:hypothetical protein